MVRTQSKSFETQFSYASHGRTDGDVLSLSWDHVLSSTGSTPLSTSTQTSVLPHASSNPNPLVVLKNNEPVGVDEAQVSKTLREEDFEIRVDLRGQGVGGKEEAKYWICDFSYVSAFGLEGCRYRNANDTGVYCRSMFRLTVTTRLEGGPVQRTSHRTVVVGSIEPMSAVYYWTWSMIRPCKLGLQI